MYRDARERRRWHKWRCTGHSALMIQWESFEELSPSFVCSFMRGCHMKNVRRRQWGRMYVMSAQHMELCSTTGEEQIAEVDKQEAKRTFTQSS